MKNQKTSDLLLVSRAALSGDKAAFGILVERYQSPIRRFLSNLTSDEELAKDLTQETFLKAWTKIESFQAAAKFSTWLFRIAYNVFYDYHRKKKELIATNNDLDNRVTSNYSNLEFNIDFSRLLDSLNPNERAVMLLYFMEDFTIEKISSITNMPIGTIKSHLHRGKNNFKLLIEK